MSRKNKQAIGIAVFILIVVAGIWNAVFQFELCQSKFDDFWFCVGHVF